MSVIEIKGAMANESFNLTAFPFLGRPNEFTDDESDDEFYNTIRISSIRDELLELARKIAKYRGGECLSTVCVSRDCDMVFKCNMGHMFNASIRSVNQDILSGSRFCPTCGGTQKKSDDAIREHVEGIGYRLIDINTKINGGKSRCRLIVQCPSGHTREVNKSNFLNKYDNLRKGCKACSSAKHGKELRVDIAAWSDEMDIETAMSQTSSAPGMSQTSFPLVQKM